MDRPITGVSLFSGAGGLDVGFERAGVSVIFANELREDPAKTYQANRGTPVMVHADINDVLDRFDCLRGADLVFGGPPCQGFSVAGKMDPEDERNKLIFTFLDVVSRVRPRVFVMENVKALGFSERWSGVRKKYLRKARALGYRTVPFLLDAAEYGVPQKRERVFFVGVKGSFSPSRMEELISCQKQKAPPVGEALRSLGRAGTGEHPLTCTAKITFAATPVMRRSPYAGMYFNGQGRPINLDGYANTLPASMGGNKTPIVDQAYLYGEESDDWVVGYHKTLLEGTVLPGRREVPKRLRRITIREAAKIQTFPDGYRFCGNKTSVYAQIGNAVPCLLAEAVGNAVVAYLRGAEQGVGVTCK